MSDHFDMQNEGMAVDIAAVAEAHGLSSNAHARLLRVVTGAIPGNRDRPVFLLAASVCASGKQDPFDLIMPRQAALSRLDAALLDFLVTVATDDPGDFKNLVAAFDAVPKQEDSVRALAAALSRTLHSYRARILPETRHHNLFTAIRRFYAQHRPEDPTPRDGDALDFWETEATRAFLTRYVTALNGVADFAEAARLAATWRFGFSLDVAETCDLPEDAGKDMADDDPLAPELLEMSFDALAATPAKLLLARELEEIRALAAIDRTARLWPMATLAALGFGPVQSAITEGMRRSTIQQDLSTYMQRAESYADLRSRHKMLNEKLMDALHLVHLWSLTEPERASARSNLPAERRKRIQAMERRKSFFEMDAAARRSGLMALIEPLLALRALVKAACTSWETFKVGHLNEVQERDEARFRTKFDALYGPQHNGEAR